MAPQATFVRAPSISLSTELAHFSSRLLLFGGNFSIYALTLHVFRQVLG